MKSARILYKLLQLILTALLLSFLYFTPRQLLLNEVDTSPAVFRALSQNEPILALESTIITHGLPYPTNLNTQLKLQKLALLNNVTPATIAILNGRPTIGLTDSQLSSLAQTEAFKASTHDLTFMKAFNKTASTTVAATAFIASSLSINVFSTGGIGGVHRFQNQFEFDVSADLTELSKTKCIVVSAGCKAILDLRGTAEVLETNQVLVIGYQTNKMPAFYSIKSGIKLDYSVNNTIEAARLFQAGKAYLLFNPIPKEFEIPAEEINPFIEKVLADMPADVKGKKVTPYLLQKMSEITKDKSVTANLALIENNVKVGSQIAFDIKTLQKGWKWRNPIFVACGKLGITNLKAVAITLLLNIITLKVIMTISNHVTAK